MVRSRTAEEDARFIESFKNYVDLLVDESCSEIRGELPVPKEKFENAGHELVEASRSLKITTDVESFVGVAEDLAENRMLAPGPGAVCSTPSGNSIYRLCGAAIKDLDGYFEKAGLTLSAGLNDFEGRPIIHMCLGEALNIDLPVGPKVTVFTKTIIENTRDAIGNRLLGVDGHSDWTGTTGIFHLFEPKLDDGRATWANFGAYSSLKEIVLEIGDTYLFREKDRLHWLAWTSFSLDSGDEDAFSKKYAIACIEDTYPHEIYHQQIAKLQDSTSTEEAAAQLYAISRNETNTFDCLRSFYGWKGSNMYNYSDAAEIAFKQLEKVGYDESLWNGLDAGDTEKVKTAGSEMRRLADAALTNLEAGMNWRNHEEVEDETGLERNYPILHTELQTL